MSGFCKLFNMCYFAINEADGPSVLSQQHSMIFHLQCIIDKMRKIYIARCVVQANCRFHFDPSN